MKTYSELKALETFEERYNYLRIAQRAGEETFGHERYLNQKFYKSREWKEARDEVIIRDNACDLGIPGHEIYTKLQVHHMVPMRPSDLLRFNEVVLDPEYLITVSFATHNAIHFGGPPPIQYKFVERTPGDTKLC